MGPHGVVRLANDFYNTLTDTEIACLDIKELADENCALFLWVTNSRLHDGLHLMKNWGFDFMTIAFVWHKTYSTFPYKTWFGLGNYTRGGAEICLLGMRGSLERKNKSVGQIQSSPIERNSKKPAWVRDSIVKLFGDLPRIELFAREKTDGWDVWGDQI